MPRERLYVVYDPEKTADNLKRIITEKGIKSTRLEQMLEMKPRGSIISRIRRGDLCNVELMCRISSALHIKLEEFVEYHREEEIAELKRKNEEREKAAREAEAKKWAEIFNFNKYEE